jgi:ribose transport system substrate-binding protein
MSMKLKALGYGCLVMIAALIQAGCGKGGNEPPKAAEAAKAHEDKVIALSVLTMTNPFFKDIANGVQAEAEKNGYSVILTSGELDVAKQKDQVKDFIVKKVSAIILCPCDSTAIAPVIKEANEAGIPVFTADISCLDASAKVQAHVATDNYDGGVKAAKALVEAVGGKGKVGMIGHPAVESGLMRQNGFIDELKRLNQVPGNDVKMIVNLGGDGDRAKSFKVMQDILQSHPDIDGLFAVNDPTAMGVCAALEKNGKLGQVKVVGFDGMVEALQAVKEGKISADIIQFPERIGKMTVSLIMDYFNGKEVKPKFLIPAEIYKREDAMKDKRLK